MEDEHAARAVRAALDAEAAADVTRALEGRERAARRHTLWALLGVSPAGLIPMVASVSEFGVVALIAGTMLISVLEASRAIQARADAMALREQLHRLEYPWTSSSARPAKWTDRVADD